MHTVASFEVKNNGKNTVIVLYFKLPPVIIPPGEKSEPFTQAATYSIQSEVENLPEPPPEVVVEFSPKGHLDARKIGSPSVKVDVIANFD